MNTQSCDCHKVKPGELKNPGDFYIELVPNGATYIFVLLPDGTGNNLPIEINKGPALSPRCWGWDGNEDKPTLTPSIHCIGSWHGWLRAGRLISC